MTVFRPSPERALLRLVAWISIVWVSIPVLDALMWTVLRNVDVPWIESGVAQLLFATWLSQVGLLFVGWRETRLSIQRAGIQVGVGGLGRIRRTMAWADMARVRTGYALGYAWATFESRVGEHIVVRVGLGDGPGLVRAAERCREHLARTRATPADPDRALADRIALAEPVRDEGTSWALRPPPLSTVLRVVLAASLVFGASWSPVGAVWGVIHILAIAWLSRRTTLRIEARRIVVWKGAGRRRELSFDEIREIAIRRYVLSAVARFVATDGRTVTVRVGLVDAARLELALVEARVRRERYLDTAEEPDPVSRAQLGRVLAGRAELERRATVTGPRRPAAGSRPSGEPVITAR